MTQTVLHVVYTSSGASSLRQALENAGRDDRVISFFDSLCFGPINPPDSQLRTNWVENELGWTGWDEVTIASDTFWREALSPNHRKLACSHGDPRWSMRAFLRGSGGWVTPPAKSSI
jgi:hypothetical protein